ncbi:MAG: hypothetical protein ACXVCN_12005 [Bdellovibrio sp.]
MAPQQDEKENTFSKDIGKAIKSSYSVVSPSQEQKESYGLDSLKQKTQQGPWYLASMKTEIGIEGSGDIGFIGAEGEAAFEYIWQRTPNSVKKLQQQYYGSNKKPANNRSANLVEGDSTDSNSLELSTDMSQSEVSQKINSLIAYVDRSHKVKNTTQLRENLTKQVQIHQEKAQQLSFAADQMLWKPYKYQLELYVQASGNVIPTIEVGCVMRLRIEWAIKEAKSFMNVSVPSKLINHANFVANEMAQALSDTQNNNNLFQFYGVKVGLGLGFEGDIDIVEAKGHAIASVFLKYNSASKEKNTKKLFNESSTEAISGISTARWKKSLRKAISMANYITEQSSISEKQMDESRPLRDFELGAIEVELTMSAGGELLLPTVNGIGFLELFYSKKGSGKF